MKLRLLEKLTLGLVASLFALSSTATPISGTLTFQADGCFTALDDGLCINSDSDTAGGYDFLPTGNATNLDGDVKRTSGDITDILGLASEGFLSLIPDTRDIELFDFSLTALPTTEWLISTVIDSVDYVLKFIITSGSETDVSNTNLRDLAGTGTLSLECTDADQSSCDGGLGYDTNALASWTLTGTEFSITGDVVPEPATLGLLGLGLIGLGIVRRRRTLVRG